ncbi:MAG: ATP-dependent DNA helicase RecG [Aquisalinus sp.]|nr:ATP-dependent DNA helicase RecG [Aquisalinus sp.]
MRPEILNPLFTDTTYLPGVGPKVAALINKVAGPRVIDLLFTLPTGLIDRSARPKITEAVEGQLVTLEVSIDKHQPPPKGMSRLPYKVLCSDESGFITLAFFHARADYLLKMLPEGSKRLISGKIERFSGGLQIVHPDHIVDPEKADELPLFEPVYPLTASLHSKTMRKAVSGAVEKCPDLREWLDPSVVAREKWPSWRDAMRSVHQPQSRLDLSDDNVHRQRLAYDELLANQLALALTRQNRQKGKGRILRGDESLRSAVQRALPFSLTNDQHQVLADIYRDMAAPTRMIRLVQGDVGSGKTVVALLALLCAVEAGAQGALMAPTEILARQHYEFIAPLLEDTNISVEIVTGRDKGQERAAKLAGLEKGYINILIGTHAIFSDDVSFNDLGLIIVDEQHRFGVFQRLALQEKGLRSDVLVMTATPIPRSLALTTYGDMDISQIREKPPGRQPVDTRAIPLERLGEVSSAVSRAIERGEQVYWVCPMVEENADIELTAVETRYAHLQQLLGDRVGLVHGKMKSAEKDAVVTAFYNKQISLLVATTVIEVGVNAPDATIMVIEHAERFGLAQLHQLRGRVGRGNRQSTCLLLYKAIEKGELGETAKARLNVLRETDDGFVIAEEDLRLRGPGDFLGSAQSGFPDFRLADASKHASLLSMARDDSALILSQDPTLSTVRGQALKTLLYLFSRNDAVKLLKSG